MATRQMTFMREAAQNAAIPKLTTGERKLDFLYAGKFDEIKNRGGLANGLEYVGASVLAGVGGIGEGIYDLTGGGLNALAGNKAYAESLFKDNVVGEWRQGVKERYNPGTGWSFGGDVAQGIGQSATMSIPYVGPYAFFAGVIGQSIGEGVRETGELGFKEVAYGTASGAVEGALEYFLGKGGQALGTWMKGIGGSSAAGSVASKAFSFLDDWAASAALKGVAKEMVSEASGEFVEEFLSEYIDVGLKRGFKIDENASTTLKQAAYAGLVGLASGAAMGGAVSGINSAFAYSSGQRVVNEGNADTLIKETRAMVDSLKIDKKSTKVDGLLVNLQRSMEMYDKAVASGNERGATMYLGEIKTYRGILEVSYSVQREAIRLADVDEATATRAAQYMSYEDGNNEVGKTYTAKDFYENKNNIRTRLAAMSWAGVFLSDSQAMRESAIFDAEIYADKMGTADGGNVVQDIDGAIFPENGGTFKIAAGDIQTAEGDYMRVMRTGEDSYAIGIGNDAQSARGYRSLTREQAEAEFKRIQGQVIANREKVAQAENLAAQAMQTDNLKRNGVRIESRADQASTAVPGAEAVTTESGEAQIGNSFEQSTMNAARNAVKNFDALDIDTKSRILRWVESAEGHNISKDVISGISNIMRIRGDLQVLLAEVGEGKAGLHKENVLPGRNLIVLPSNRDVDILRETIAHELGHEVENVKGFGELKKAAVKATKAEDIKKWEKLYEGYPDADTEVAMKALGRRLATPKFIERYADRSMIRRIIDGGKAFLKMLRADEAGRLEIATTEKLIRMLNEALIKGEVSQNEAKGESGTTTKYLLNTNARSELHKALYDTKYRKEVLLRDETPAIMIAQKGVKNLPMVMNASHIRENVFTEAEAANLGLRIDSHTHYHGLGEDFFLKVIDGLDSVKEAYRGTKNAKDPARRENYFLLVSEFKDKNGSTINVPVYINEHAQYNQVFVDANKISTVFGRDNFVDYINKQITEQNLVKIKNRSTQTSERNALIAKGYGKDASDDSISQNSEKSTPSAKKSNNLTEETQKEVFNEVFEASENASDIPDDRVLQSTTRYSLLEAPRLAEQTEARNAKDGNVAPRTLKRGLETMKQMAALMKPYLSKEGILPPDVIGKTAWKNGSYGRTMENTTLCVRTLTYEYFKDEVAKAIGRPLTVAESLLASQKIYDIATYPQCIYCYVAADRKSYDAFIGEYMSAMDKYIKLLREGGDSDQLFQEYLRGRDPTNAQKKRWAEWRRIAKSGESYISAADVNTRSKRNALISKGGKAAEQVRDAHRYAQSASWAKSVSDYVAYNGDVLKFSQKMVDMLNSEYGLRMYSFSDYTPAFIVENMQMVLDASVRGLKVLSYTKDADYVRIFGDSGMAINMSCFARYDSKTGTYIEDSRQGMKWDEVKQLRAEHKNAGAVMVVTDDNMLNWALDQDWVDVVIPYHIVKTGTTIAGAYSWRNYTRESADYAGNKTSTIYPTEHNNDFEQFRKLVEERGITPRFNEWYERAVKGEISGDKYMKLVNEVRVPAGQLAAVEPKFDLQAALDSFGIDAEGNAIEGGYVDKGGYMGNWFKAGVDVMQEVKVVAEDIEAGRTVSDVEYGRQSMREAGGVPKKRYNLTDDAADQREQELRKRERKASKAEREAEISRIETRARDYNAYYYKYEDIKSLIDTINKEAKLGFDDVSDAAFEAYSLLNAFRAEVYKADYRQSFLETTTEYLIEAADAQAGRELRLGDIDRRKKVYKMLNEAYEKLAKVTPKQKTEGRRAQAEAQARFEHKTAELHMLLNRVDQRNFRLKTAGILEGEAWKTVTKAAKAMRTRGANIRFGDMKTFAEAFSAYLQSKATSLYNAAKSMTEESLKEWNKQVAEGDNELYKRINLKTAAAIIEFAEGNDTDFTDSNIAATVAALKTALTIDAYTDKFINANGEAVDAEAIVADEIEGMRKSYGGIAGKFARTTFGKALRYGIYNVISPEAVAHRIDGILGAGYLSRGIRAIQRSSLDAQYDQMVWLMPITDFIQEQKKSNRQWWKEWQDGSVTITYSLPFGKGEVAKRTITLTKGEAASLYLTSKREQAKAALALGRISVTDAEGRKSEQFSRRRFNMDAIDEWLNSNKLDGMTDEEVNGIVIQLEQAMQTAIDGMYSQFNVTDKAFIEKISTFYQTTSKQIKQASDTRCYGSTNVFDGFYYPIARSGLEFDFDFIGSNMRGLDDVSLRNYPFNKSTVKGARAQLQINDILVVLDRHSRQLAMYKNLTIPMQNLRLVYNHRLTEGAKENIDTVRKYINEYIWPSQGGKGGFDQWIGDFSNAVQKRNIGGKTEFDAVLDKIQGGYVVAALGLNPSSVAKQWSTIMQMVEEVPMHIWMKAYAPAENKDKMTEKSRYAAIRANSPELYRAQGTTAELNDAMSYTLKGLEWGDRLVNLRMWNMAQHYIAETKGYSVGSEQNLNAAGKLLDEWIMRFQDTSDASTKSALQRHPQKLAQAVTMFTSAAMKKFSAWYTYLTDAVEAKRMLDSGKLSAEERKRTEKIFADSKKKLAKSSSGILAAAAFEAAVTLAWAALRGKDDEEEKEKKLVAKIALETGGNVIGIVPVAGQIAESLISGYDMDNLYESIINDGIGTVRTTYQLSAKAISGETVESEAVIRNARSWVYLMSQALGVPTRNLNNVFTAALNVISPVAPEAKYKYDAIFYEPTYAADMSKALKSGKTELAQTIYTMAQKDIKTSGAADSAVVGEMVRLYGLEYNVLPRSAPTSYEDAEGNTVKLKAAQARQFSEIYGAADGAAAMVVTSPVYTALSDELKAKALRVVYEIYHSRAKSEVLGGELSVIAALSYFDGYLDIPTLVTESAYIYGIKSTEDAKRSELVREYVSGYSREAQALLLYAAGYRSEDIKEVLSDMISQLDEATQERVRAKIDV